MATGFCLYTIYSTEETPVGIGLTCLIFMSINALTLRHAIGAGLKELDYNVLTFYRAKALGHLMRRQTTQSPQSELDADAS